MACLRGFHARPGRLSRALSTRAELPLNSLTAVAAIDGRYGRQTAELRDLFSEFALIKYRTIVEIEWLRALAAAKVRIPLEASAARSFIRARLCARQSPELGAMSLSCLPRAVAECSGGAAAVAGC